MPSAELPTIDRSCLTALLGAHETYFDLMYDCDTSRFDHVFCSSVHLHGFRDGAMVVWSAETYRDILGTRRSPKSQGSPRTDEILMIAFTASTQAVTKVRLRIAAMVFIDDLTWHRIDGNWLVTSKAFHLVSDEGASAEKI